MKKIPEKETQKNNKHLSNLQLKSGNSDITNTRNFLQKQDLRIKRYFLVIYGN